MPSKPVLSDADKENIRKKLKGLCEECWITQGYKKTSIKSLCEKAGISVGTFYTLYPTKEDLFFETIETIQRRLEEKIFAINRDRRTKDGFSESMKELFKEYDSKPFLYNVNTPDFQSFITKLPEETIKKVVQKCFEEEKLLNSKLIMTITLTTPEQIRKINNQYRNIDKATDVLSFPMFEKQELDEKIENNDFLCEDILGDIVISIEKVKEQAEEYGHSFERELGYMIVHGFYHLMGYDHIEEEDKKIMRPKEENVLRILGIIR